jgi:hypothetical protein
MKLLAFVGVVSVVLVVGPGLQEATPAGQQVPASQRSEQTIAQASESDLVEPVSDALIEEALALANDKKGRWGVMLAPMSYSIVVTGPIGRIAGAAREAAAAYKPFTRAEVTPELAQNLIAMTVIPDKPSYNKYSGWSVAPPAEHLVVQPPKSKSPETAVQPCKMETFPVSWSNSFGMKFEGQGLRALFRPTDLPEGEIEVVVISGTGEQRARLKAEDRAKIR